LLTALFADAALGGIGLAEGRSIGGQTVIQLTGIGVTLLWSAAVSFVIIKVTDMVAGLRVSAEIEEQGLDLKEHGERAYNM
jgi:Amt family ammonium transporter